MKMCSKICISVFAMLVVLGALWHTFVFSGRKKPEIGVKSAESSASVDSQANWEAGTTSNINSSSSPGSVQISNKTIVETIFRGGTFTTNTGTGDPNALNDENISTGVSLGARPDELPYSASYIRWDFDQTHQNIIAYTTYIEGDGSYINTIDCGYPNKIPGVGFESACPNDTPSGSPSNWWQFQFGLSKRDTLWYRMNYNAHTASSYTIQNSDLAPAVITEIYGITGEATATHTSAATQITNANLYQWQTFTPTYTEPANTTVSFRLRTSTDAATWTSWTAYQTPNSAEALDISSLVTSKTGDAGSETFYKYIQVETKLTSSDGVSTPTIDSYSIGYHTNVVPNKPTGATATAGD